MRSSGSPSDQRGCNGKHSDFSHPGAAQGSPKPPDRADRADLTTPSLQSLTLHHQLQSQKERNLLRVERLVPISGKDAVFAALVWCSHKIPLRQPFKKCHTGYLLNSIRLAFFLAVQCLRLGTEPSEGNGAPLTVRFVVPIILLIV